MVLIMFPEGRNGLYCIIFNFLIFFHVSHGLYEDQIRKFDWRKLYIGKVENAFSEAFSNRLLVTTEENVIASLCAKTGEILWRQILEKGSRGNIKLVEILKEENGVSTDGVNRNGHVPVDILTVQGYAPAIVRGWSADSGKLEWEWSLMPMQPEKAERSFWFYEGSHLFHIIPVWNANLEVTKYVAVSGQGKGTTSKISAPWIRENHCILANPYYVCLQGNQMIFMDLTLDQPEVIRKVLQFEPKEKPRILKGRKGTLIIDDKLVSLSNTEPSCSEFKGESLLQTAYNERFIVLQSQVKNKVLHISAIYADTCEKINNLNVALNYSDNYGSQSIYSFDCKTNRNNVDICSIVLVTSDGAVIFVQQGKIKWIREESLTNIVDAEFIDLPLSDSEGSIESELNSKTGDILGAFLRRISSQIHQMKSIFFHVLGLGLPPSATQKAGLIRDAFGLHKMLIVLTKSGKLFGIDNLTGKHHWIQLLQGITNFNNDEAMKVLVQRTSKHFPHQPLCTVVGKNTLTDNGVVYQFNPITGQPTERGLIQLPFKIKQVTLLRENENEFLKGLLLLDEHNGIHVLPESSKKSAEGMYLYTADKSSATINGYFVQNVQQNLVATPIWNIRLGGHGNDHKIIAIASKNPIERVHSQGRVLADRSVLYKYINPNLITVVTEALDNIHKYVMNVHLVDVVSGSVVLSMAHRKVRGPLHIVHSENWMAYSYYNEKVRRTEITTVELYEGKVQANSTVWSSLDAPPMPLIEKQSYIVPASVETMRETITERGITNKHVLIGLSSGGVVEMPWALLDPRRPVSAPSQAREEGGIPYIPELPLPTENIINYNQTVSRLKKIYTAPSGLESTCLVLATGLDLFVTRVSPSKTFDLLKEDFDYFLITVVLVALTTGSFLAKQLSARKALKQAWK